MGLSIVYYQTRRGDCPVQDYIESLSDKERAKVKSLIAYLSEKKVLREPHAKKIAGYHGLYELRPADHRIFYCYFENKVVLLHAFRKKSNKTPKNEIELALMRMKD